MHGLLYTIMIFNEFYILFRLYLLGMSADVRMTENSHECNLYAQKTQPFPSKQCFSSRGSL